MKVSLTLLVFCMATAAYGQKISVDRNHMWLDQELHEVLTFRLNSPIICENPHVHCNVVVLITNDDPNTVDISDCSVEWDRDQWDQPQTVVVRAVDNFVEDVSRTVNLVTEPAISHARYYRSFDMEDIVVQTRPRPSRTCHSTGDPHYKTFDGFPYHIFWPGEGIFVKSTRRDFEVQSRWHQATSNRPALNCAIAAKESNDLVIFDVCDGTPRRIIRGLTPSDSPMAPRVTVSGGRTFTVEFASGANVRVDVHGPWHGKKYMNVYVQVPGSDYGGVYGMCGNNDGSAGNDVPGLGWNAWLGQGNMPSSWIIPQGQSLWDWQPPANTPARQPPPTARRCAYQRNLVHRPVLRNVDIEDVTELIRRGTPAVEEARRDYQFVPATNVEAPATQFDETRANAVCNDRLRNSRIGQLCLDVVDGFDMDLWVDQCVEDLRTMNGDEQFVEDALSGMQFECETQALTNTAVNVGGEADVGVVLGNAMCVHDCTGHGTCTEGRCVCDDGWLGPDCSVDADAAPDLSVMEPFLCHNRGDCVNEVALFGENFIPGQALACHFGDEVVPATYVGMDEVRCSLPTFSHTGGVEHVVDVTVTNDGVSHSNTVKFVYYDAVCLSCERDGTCALRESACRIDGHCYSQGQPSVENPCQICDAAQSTSEWSTSSNPNQCGPIFQGSDFQTEIPEGNYNGEFLLQVQAHNDDWDESMSVTYSLHGFPAGVIDIDASNGRVSMAADVTLDFEAARVLVGQVRATDSNGNWVEEVLHVNVVDVNESPSFAEAQVQATLDENTAPGTPVNVAINAEDPDVYNMDGFGDLTYSISFEEVGAAGIFSIDPESGVISVSAELDYELKPQYLLRVQAADQASGVAETEVTVYLNDVNEAPTDIVLTGVGSVAENVAGDVELGTLSATDPEDEQEHSFAVVDGAGIDLDVVDGKLVLRSAVDYESVLGVERQVNGVWQKDVLVMVRATDDGMMSDGRQMTPLSLEKEVTIVVRNVNEAPHSLSLTVSSFATSRSVGYVVGNVRAEDPEGGRQQVSFECVSCSRFRVNGDKVILNQAGLSAGTYDINVKAIDSEGLESAVVTFTLTAADEGAFPVIDSVRFSVDEQTAVGTSIGTITARDSDSNDGVDLDLLDNANGAFQLGNPTCAANGQCVVEVVTLVSMSYEVSEGQYEIVVRASDRSADALTVTRSLYVTVANPDGTETSESADSSADSEDSSTGEDNFLLDEDAALVAAAATGKSGSSNAGAVAGGVVGGLLVLAVLILFFMYQRKTPQEDLMTVNATHLSNPIFKSAETSLMPTYESVDDNVRRQAFRRGCVNPLYSWYQPELSRQESESFLRKHGQGSFCVRDASTDNWFVLSVKNANNVEHVNIRVAANGAYVLENSSQQFATIPDLVEHFSERREGMEFSLNVGNPLYDNQCLSVFRGSSSSLRRRVTTTPLHRTITTDGPALPAKANRRRSENLVSNSTYEVVDNAAVQGRAGVVNPAYQESDLGSPRGGIANATYDGSLVMADGQEVYGYSNT